MDIRATLGLSEHDDHEFVTDEIKRLVDRLGHFQRGFETILGAVPTTWCDPLLTGEDGITVPADWTNIEKLLNGLKGRIKAIVEEAITVEGQRPEQCGCTFCVRDGQHESDCAVHLPPAYDSGICDCSRAVERQEPCSECDRDDGVPCKYHQPYEWADWIAHG